MIPITFNKDDLENEKKGTMRAQDLASLVGLLYPKKVGVLDIFDNAVVVTNIDLSTTGYVKLSWSKGYVVAYGRLIYIDQGDIATFPLPASTESGNIGISINLAESGANEVEWFMRSGTLTQNNLLNEPANGVCEIALYNYTANSTTFNLGTRVAQTIPNITDYLNGANFVTQPVSDNSNKLATTAFVKSNTPLTGYVYLRGDGISISEPIYSSLRFYTGIESTERLVNNFQYSGLAVTKPSGTIFSVQATVVHTDNMQVAQDVPPVKIVDNGTQYVFVTTKYPAKISYLIMTK